MMIIISEVLLHGALVSAVIGVYSTVDVTQDESWAERAEHLCRKNMTSSSASKQSFQNREETVSNSEKKKMINEYLAYFCSLIIQAL